MINAHDIAKGLEWFIEHHHPKQLKSNEWRKARDQWLRSRGVGGIMKDVKKSKSLPDWWNSDSEFWFITEEQEKEFLRVFCSD